jgi:hypothetical protein
MPRTVTRLVMQLCCHTMLQSRQMKRLYLFTLEIVPLEIGKIYDKLPSHLTLMSRFLSDLPPNELTTKIQPLFAKTTPVLLVFGITTALGPKKVTAHMVNSPDELRLHDELHKTLDTTKAEYKYPEFIGSNHKPHVTQREGMQFTSGSGHRASAAYLIEIVDKQRVVRARFELGEASNAQEQVIRTLN